MKYSQRQVCVLTSIILGGVLLSGCSKEGMFRNRNFDYLRTDVQQMPALKTPPDVPAPKSQAYLAIPAGQNNYTPTTQANVNLAPPDMNTVVSIPAAEQTPAVANDTNASSKPASKVATTGKSPANTNQVSAVKPNSNSPTSKDASAVNDVKSIANPVAIPAANLVKPAATDKPTTSMRASMASANNTAVTPSSAASVSETAAVNPVAIPAASVVKPAADKSMTSMSTTAPSADNSVTAPISSSTKAVANPVAIPKATLVTPTEKAAPNRTDAVVSANNGLQPALSFNDSNQGMITVTAPYTTTWQKVGQAIAQSDFQINTQDAQKGYYIVAPRNLPSAGHTYMVSITQQAKVSQIQIYDMTAQLATSLEASDLLKAISSGLQQ